MKSFNDNLLMNFGDINWRDQKEIIGLIKMCGFNDWNWETKGNKWINEYSTSGGELSGGGHCYKCDGGGTYMTSEGDEYDCDECIYMRIDVYSLRQLQELLIEKRNDFLGRKGY
jgi:hypothetical protein